MNNEIISLTGFEVGHLSATEAARMERDALLHRAGVITTVMTPEESENVTDAQRELKEFMRRIETSHEEVKRPVLERSRSIDALKRELITEVELEYSRLGKANGAFLDEQRRRADEAEKKAREEEARILREAAEKERAERDRLRKEEEERIAKERAIQEELEAKAKRARTEEGRARAEKEAQEARIKAEKEAQERATKAEAESQQRLEDAKLASVTARVAGNQLTAKKPIGTSTRKDLIVEVTDIFALYEASPFFVLIAPNEPALKAAIKNLQPGQTIPGVSWRWEATTHVR